MRIKTYAVLAILVLTFGCTCSDNTNYGEMKKFNEIYFDGDIVELKGTIVDRKKNMRIINILYYYGVEFRLDTAGNIYIPENIYNDKDFILSITSKSNDDNWYNSNIIKNLSDSINSNR